jgi:hypothetical protein
MLVSRAQQPLGRPVQRLVPRCLAKAAAVVPDEGVEDALRRVHAVEIVRHLAAQEADRDRMVGIAAHLCGAAVLDRHVHGAGVRAVVRAGGADEAGGGHGANGVARGVAVQGPGRGGPVGGARRADLAGRPCGASPPGEPAGRMFHTLLFQSAQHCCSVVLLSSAEEGSQPSALLLSTAAQDR